MKCYKTITLPFFPLYLWIATTCISVWVGVAVAADSPYELGTWMDRFFGGSGSKKEGKNYRVSSFTTL